MGTAARKVLKGRRMRDQTAAGKETGLHHTATETRRQGLFKKVARGWKSFFSQGYPQELIQISKIKIFHVFLTYQTTKADDHRLNKRHHCCYPPAHHRHFLGLTGQPCPTQGWGPAPAPWVSPATRITPSLSNNFLLHSSPMVPRIETADKCGIHPKGHSLLPDHIGGWEPSEEESCCRCAL